jgi:hypothetical protein
MEFVAVKALAGSNYVRPDQVIAVTSTEQNKCLIVMAGGVTVVCYESGADTLAKISAALAKPG